MTKPDISFIADLEAIVRSRLDEGAVESYTARLAASGTRRIAQKVGVLNRVQLCHPPIEPVAPVSDEVFPVKRTAAEACPRYLCRIVRGIDPAAVTPQWMQEKLRRSGLRPIHPVVDVTNIVMLELGQPLHGFDLDTLDGGIVVRMGEAGEQLTLLDERVIELDPDMLVIADHGGPRALAGIMGGETSGVEAETRNVFFEGAFFSPGVIAGRARRLGLHTDASMRFERGVDPAGQRRAIERATRLLMQIAGGQAGPVIEVASQSHLPGRQTVSLRRGRLAGGRRRGRPEPHPARPGGGGAGTAPRRRPQRRRAA